MEVSRSKIKKFLIFEEVELLSPTSKNTKTRSEKISYIFPKKLFSYISKNGTFLRSYEITHKSYFCVRHKNRRKHVLNCCFSQQIYNLSHQTKYLYIENQNRLSQAVFIQSFYLQKCKEDPNRRKYATLFFTLSEKKRPTNL